MLLFILFLCVCDDLVEKDSSWCEFSVIKIRKKEKKSWELSLMIKEAINQSMEVTCYILAFCFCSLISTCRCSAGATVRTGSGWPWSPCPLMKPAPCPLPLATRRTGTRAAPSALSRQPPEQVLCSQLWGAVPFPWLLTPLVSGGAMHSDLRKTD